MGELDVASVVASILAALNNGILIFQRLGKKKRKTNARPPRPFEEEEWQEHSLANRPSEIRHSYSHHVSRHGRRFEVGDDTAHFSLAHTLLVLNTGLVNFLNHALSKDSKSRSTSRKALFTLSETATMETLTTLGQLSSRLSLNYPTEARLGLSEDEATKHHRRKKRHIKAPTSTPSRPRSSPLLANGGWVRSKSGSSVVSRAEAKRTRNVAEESNSRNKSTPTLLKASMSQTNIRRSTREGNPKDGDSHRPGRKASEEDSHLHKLAIGLVPSSESLGHHLQRGEKSNRLQKEPHIRPRSTTKIRPVSTATFLTTSTKIGEIPESKWHDRVLSPEELTSRKLPYVVPPPLDTGEPKRKNKGFKFWKRGEKEQEIPSY
ncbi:uncharacterized protein A1O9_01781 [Exophiala aquamarina CBS 119918]|uniref:Uncharacterized protein n=1 Tax=Exophiala aquamarina CBS 119918 TaxID=1182545 RepID=A0A072PWS3_9EURO|nr:uncharacterized protein A1O9_01781 [Exophiala aquamarina CBS 119918]KEF63803.1 hypothetical protein A1O9_01781 [Exophiala aquamarina CBS 119918]